MKTVIASVGGTPDPVVRTMLEHGPEFVCWFASQQSLDKIGEIKSAMAGQGCSCGDHKVLVDDAQDLVHCYGKAVECARLALERAGDARDVVVDYTGGTKTMSAALALATVSHGFTFSYVGGDMRTAGGLGVVMDGHERVVTGVSPWAIFAVEEKTRIGQMVGGYRYEAASAMVQATLPRLGDSDKQVWELLRGVLEGYRAWDNFDHKGALEIMPRALSDFSRLAPFIRDEPLLRFMDEAGANVDTLKKMAGLTKGFNRIHACLAADLVSNARRRAAQNKYDDAMARLYRALEMVGQGAFEERFRCSTSAARPDCLPEVLRGEYGNRYLDPDKGVLKLPQHATFRALAAAGHDLGNRFMDNYGAIRDIQSARNESILAHGTSPVKAATYGKFEAVLRDLFIPDPLVEFARLDW